MQNIWGTKTQTHGGVIPENVRVESNGDVTIALNGDHYAGNKRGVSLDDKTQRIENGKRTGGVVISRDAYGPGSFEAVMKIPSVNGVCTSLWLFNYWESGGQYNNHEIDIELHGTVNDSTHGVGTYRKALFTSWLTETVFESEYKNVGYALNDGQFHKYRIDWHTGAYPRVEYYIDDVLLCTQTTHVPNNEMYVNIGCWFPNNWCGEPNFETDTMVIRSFGYTPFVGETAGKANTDGYAVTENRYLVLPASGSGFQSNLIANGGFDAERTDYMWTFTGDPPVKTDNGVTFTGSMSQTVELDCGGLELRLLLSGSGAATVTINYGSIVNGVTVEGSRTFEFDGVGTFDFVPPDGCTALTVTVAADGSATLESATLTVLGAAR